jgi:hypothetical protein
MPERMSCLCRERYISDFRCEAENRVCWSITTLLRCEPTRLAKNLGSMEQENVLDYLSVRRSCRRLRVRIVEENPKPSHYRGRTFAGLYGSRPTQKGCFSVHKAASRVRRCDNQPRIALDSAARFRRAKDSAGPRRIAHAPSFSISQPFKPEGNSKSQPKLTRQRLAPSDIHEIVTWSVMPKGKDAIKLSRC